MGEHKVILVGAGDMAGNHIRAWNEVGQKVVAVVDVDQERASRLQETWSVPKRYSDYQEAIDQEEDADIVDVCVPLRWHAPVTIYAADHKKHVLCEKPIARSLEEVDSMQLAISRNNVKFAVAHQRNLSPGVDLLRRWVQEGKFGRPLMLYSDGLAQVRPKRFMHDKENNNGPIVDTCIHQFLMWETILQAKPVRVYAQGGIIARDHPALAQFSHLAVDTATITVTFETGDVGVMNISWGLPDKTRLKGNVERIIGPKGGVDSGTAQEFNPAYTSDETKFRLLLGDQEESVSVGVANAFALQAKAFVDYVEGTQSEPATDLRVGRHLLEISLAALSSIESGEPVRL